MQQRGRYWPTYARSTILWRISIRICQLWSISITVPLLVSLISKFGSLVQHAWSFCRKMSGWQWTWVGILNFYHFSMSSRSIRAKCSSLEGWIISKNQVRSSFTTQERAAWSTTAQFCLKVFVTREVGVHAWFTAALALFPASKHQFTHKWEWNQAWARWSTSMKTQLT